MNQIKDILQEAPSFTDKQGQYLAFINAYTLVNGRPPAEADMPRFIRVTPPSVHHMVITLEKAGLIARTPGAPRGIAIRLNPDALPPPRPGNEQLAKSHARGC